MFWQLGQDEAVTISHLKDTYYHLFSGNYLSFDTLIFDTLIICMQLELNLSLHSLNILL